MTPGRAVFDQQRCFSALISLPMVTSKKDIGAMGRAVISLRSTRRLARSLDGGVKIARIAESPLDPSYRLALKGDSMRKQRTGALKSPEPSRAKDRRHQLEYWPGMNCNGGPGFPGIRKV